MLLSVTRQNPSAAHACSIQRLTFQSPVTLVARTHRVTRVPKEKADCVCFGWLEFNDSTDSSVKLALYLKDSQSLFHRWKRQIASFIHFSPSCASFYKSATMAADAVSHNTVQQSMDTGATVIRTLGFEARVGPRPIWGMVLVLQHLGERKPLISVVFKSTSDINRSC